MSLGFFCSVFSSKCLFAIVVFYVFSHGVQSLQFTVEPISVDAVQGRPINLQCEVDEANAQIQWMLNGQTLDIDNDDRLYLEENSLRIAEVNKDRDAGEFTCVASSGSETITSVPATLTIMWISASTKVILKTPVSLDDIVEGTRVALQCKGDGNPVPEYSWYKDGTLLQPSDNLEISNRLKIKAIALEDSGKYSCRAENRAGIVWSAAGNLTITIEDPSAPSVLVAPEDVLAVSGDTVQFDCSFNGSPQPSVVWYYRKTEDSTPLGPLTNGDGTDILANGSLILEAVKSGEAGAYLCIARHDGNQLDNLVLEANLVIAEVDDLLPLGPQIVVENSIVRINCTFVNNAPGGIPLPDITWFDSSGTEVTKVTTERMHVEGTYLVFKRVHQSDEGPYTCKATNIGGEKETKATVIIATEPEITLKPTDTTIREMTTGMLHCQADGNPRPNIAWSRTTSVMEDQFETLDNGTLMIYNAQPDDGGVYVCNASNIAGFKVAHAIFLAEVILKFKPEPISKTLEENEQGKLVCNAVAQTTPNVQWFRKNDQSLEAITEAHIVTGNGTLLFKPAMKTDAGLYTCVATAGLEIINATVKVNVYVKPKFTRIPKNFTGYEGYPLSIDCQARGDPPPAITWTSIAPNKLPSHFNALDNGTLIVEELLLTDRGRYQCVAGNRAGLNTTEIVITVRKGNPPLGAYSPELMTRTIAIAVGCAAAYIILVIGLMWWCRHRRRKQRRLMKEEEEGKANGTLPNGEAVPLNEYRDNDAAKLNNVMAINAAVVANNRAARRASYDKMQFPRHDLQSIAVIGHGAFGEVFLARAVGIRDGEEATTVMVKALQTRDEHQQLEFRREIDLLTKVNHANIIKLLGLCRESEPQLLITEYLDWGDLKQYLRATRGENGTTNNPPPLTLPQKMDVINQVALGMEHLSNNRYIHADLAARNCLLSPSMEVKVCFMGTSKDLYRAEYHDYHQCLMPVRWMAPEALFEDDISTKSDVWAYGVLIYEVFSQGEMPYSTLDNDAFMKAAIDKEALLELPEGTPEEVQRIMQRCREVSPKDRCSFSEVIVAMSNITTDSSV